jgi:hypothetical protein
VVTAVAVGPATSVPAMARPAATITAPNPSEREVVIGSPLSGTPDLSIATSTGRGLDTHWNTCGIGASTAVRTSPGQA